MRETVMLDTLLPLDVNPFPNLVFIDCEASRLERPSYPIEVGLAWCDGRSEGHLVCPAEEWDEWEWSLAAMEIHKIARGDLFRHGKQVEWVADWLNRRCAGRVVCSDNPAYEAYWLGELFKAAGVAPSFAIEDSYALVNAALIKTPQGLGAYDALKKQVIAAHPITHRAADDALFWAAFFREAMALGQQP